MKKPYMPTTDAGILAMLIAFNTNIRANNTALANKYGLSATDIDRVRNGMLSFEWFLALLEAMRNASQSFTGDRDLMFTGTGAAMDLPGAPTLPPQPTAPGPDGPLPVYLDPGFFTFFAALVAKIKNAPNYDPVDGTLLGIEGSEMPAPDPQAAPVLHGDLFTSGRPELTCKIGQMQGYDVYLTRPGVARRQIGYSNSRRYEVHEPLPAAGTVEIWTFEVQYHYQGAPFGPFSAPLQLSVRG